MRTMEPNWLLNEKGVQEQPEKNLILDFSIFSIAHDFTFHATFTLFITLSGSKVI